MFPRIFQPYLFHDSNFKILKENLHKKFTTEIIEKSIVFKSRKTILELIGWYGEISIFHIIV